MKNNYESPLIVVLSLSNEGILCDSFEGGGENGGWERSTSHSCTSVSPWENK